MRRRVPRPACSRQRSAGMFVMFIDRSVVRGRYKSATMTISTLGALDERNNLFLDTWPIVRLQAPRQDDRITRFRTMSRISVLIDHLEFTSWISIRWHEGTWSSYDFFRSSPASASSIETGRALNGTALLAAHTHSLPVFFNEIFSPMISRSLRRRRQGFQRPINNRMPMQIH